LKKNHQLPPISQQKKGGRGKDLVENLRHKVLPSGGERNNQTQWMGDTATKKLLALKTAPKARGGGGEKEDRNNYPILGNGGKKKAKKPSGQTSTGEGEKKGNKGKKRGSKTRRGHRPTETTRRGAGKKKKNTRKPTKPSPKKKPIRPVRKIGKRKGNSTARKKKRIQRKKMGHPGGGKKGDHGSTARGTKERPWGELQRSPVMKNTVGSQLGAGRKPPACQPKKSRKTTQPRPCKDPRSGTTASPGRRKGQEKRKNPPRPPGLKKNTKCQNGSQEKAEATGGKTGVTEASGHCRASLWEKLHTTPCRTGTLRNAGSAKKKNLRGAKRRSTAEKIV